MSDLVCRKGDVAGEFPELEKLTRNERSVLLEFMLYTMDTEQRRKLMANHPRLYNVLFPGHLKVRVTLGNTPSTVICEE
jgi:hypothetical protein